MRTLKIAHIIGSGHAGLSIMQAVARTERAGLAGIVVVDTQQQVREMRELKRIELAVNKMEKLPQPTLVTKQQWWKRFEQHRKRRKK